MGARLFFLSLVLLNSHIYTKGEGSRGGLSRRLSKWPSVLTTSAWFLRRVEPELAWEVHVEVDTPRILKHLIDHSQFVAVMEMMVNL